MNNNKIYITLSIFTLVSLFLVIFLVWPLWSEIKNNSGDLISTKNNLVVLDAQANETKNFEKNYQTYKSNLDKLDQLFVDPNDPVDFIKFLEDTAYNSQITSQISLPTSSNSSQQFINIQVVSKGSFSGVSDFLKKIEAGPYLIEIENLTIQVSQEFNSGDTSVSKSNYPKAFDATFAIKVFTKK